jgi:hypothetical protein
MLQVLSILIATTSLIVSFYVAYRAWKFNDISTRRSSRETHTQMLFEIDKLLIQYPELWEIYDTNSFRQKRDTSPLATARREAFLYQHFNMFETIHDYYKNIISRDATDESYWDTWKAYIKQMFKESSEARRLFQETHSQEIYNKQFRSFVESIIKEISPTNTSPVQ